ncbi:small subunit ribosomal protein S12e [Enteropsectra breve]|nr:small subunit ribosomal protein S12e [Enteropsectra breve]
MNTESYEMGEMTRESALKELFTVSKNHRQLAVGAAEVVKTLARAGENAHDAMKVVVLANDLQNELKAVVLSLCESKKITTILLDDRKALGELVSGSSKKGCGAVGIKQFIGESKEKAFIINSAMN